MANVTNNFNFLKRRSKNPFVDGEVLDDALGNSYNRNNRSPVFPFPNSSTIASGGEYLIDFEIDTPASKKYLPFNNILAINNSANDILVFISQRRDQGMLVRAGDSLSVPSDVFTAVRSILYSNEGSSSITANQVRFLVSNNNATTEKLAENLHRLMNRGFRISKENVRTGDLR